MKCNERKRLRHYPIISSGLRPRCARSRPRYRLYRENQHKQMHNIWNRSQTNHDKTYISCLKLAFETQGTRKRTIGCPTWSQREVKGSKVPLQISPQIRLQIMICSLICTMLWFAICKSWFAAWFAVICLKNTCVLHIIWIMICSDLQPSNH